MSQQINNNPDYLNDLLKECVLNSMLNESKDNMDNYLKKHSIDEESGKEDNSYIL